MPRDFFDDYGDPEHRGKVVERKLAAAGIYLNASAAAQKAPPGAGSVLVRANAYLAGSTFSALGGSNGCTDDSGARYDMTLGRCVEHPRLDLESRLYADRVWRCWWVDGEPFADLDKAAAVLEEKEKAGGIYSRPMFTAGDGGQRPD